MTELNGAVPSVRFGCDERRKIIFIGSVLFKAFIGISVAWFVEIVSILMFNYQKKTYLSLAKLSNYFSLIRIISEKVKL